MADLAKRHIARLRGALRKLDEQEQRMQKKWGDRVAGSQRSSDWRLAESIRAALAKLDPDGVKTGEPRGPVHSCKNCAHLAKDSCDDPCAGCTVRWRSGVSDRWEPAPGMGPSAGARPLSEWHEDDGPVTWWKFPVDEPAWIGTPNSSDWPGYHTHWTPHPPMPLGVQTGEGGEHD